MHDPSEADQVYLAAVPRLHHVAYHVLRDSGEAEHVVQEVWIRWQGVDHSAVDRPEAFLTTVTRRLALNYLASARRRLEVTSAEPPDQGGGIEPSEVVEAAARLDSMVDVMLRRLSPVELGVYVLREGFGYTHDQLSALLRTHPANTRQALMRARRRMSGELRHHRCGTTNGVDRQRLVNAIGAAAHMGDLCRLEQALALLVEPPPIATGGAA